MGPMKISIPGTFLVHLLIIFRANNMGFKLRTIFVISVIVLGLAYYTGPRFPKTANNPGLKIMSGIIINGVLSVVSS